MRDWRNRQTRTFKGRVGDRVSSSLTSRTKRTSTNVLVLFYLLLHCNKNMIGGILRLRYVAFANKFARLSGRRARLRDRGRPGSDGIAYCFQLIQTCSIPIPSLRSLQVSQIPPKGLAQMCWSFFIAFLH